LLKKHYGYSWKNREKIVESGANIASRFLARGYIVEDMGS